MTDWSTLKKLIWLHIGKGGGGIERTVKGAIVHVINALARPAISVKCEVNPIQDLHGYDSPWPAGGGKNKFNPAEAQNNKWINNNTGEIESVSGFWVTGFIPVKSGDVIRSALKGSARNAWYNADKSQATYFAFNGEGSATAPSDGFVVLTVSSSTVAYGSDFIVTINDADLTFSPYSNICPISGRTSATVTRTGKNVFSVDPIALGGTNPRTQSVSIGTIPLGTYYFSAVRSGTATGSFGIQFFNNGTFVGETYSESQNITLTDTANRVYAYMSSGDYRDGKTLVLSDIQLEFGSTASAYEPYAGNTYTIQLGDTVYGGTLDVTGGKMVVDRAMVDLGTLNWELNAQGFMWSPGIRSTAKPPANSSILGNIICSDFQTVTAISIYNGWNGIGLHMNSDIRVRYDNMPTDASAFKAAMSGVQLCYELATPFEITLTPTQIEMLLGENNLWADAGDSTLTYYADGNASTSEALGILLGGTYNNPGGADDASDDEALGILLGGS